MLDLPTQQAPCVVDASTEACCDAARGSTGKRWRGDAAAQLRGCAAAHRGAMPVGRLAGLLVCEHCGGTFRCVNGREYGCASHRAGRQARPADRHPVLSERRVRYFSMSRIVRRRFPARCPHVSGAAAFQPFRARASFPWDFASSRQNSSALTMCAMTFVSSWRTARRYTLAAMKYRKRYIGCRPYRRLGGWICPKCRARGYAASHVCPE